MVNEYLVNGTRQTIKKPTAEQVSTPEKCRKSGNRKPITAARGHETSGGHY